MLTPITKADIPNYRSTNRSPLRVFCEETAREFLATAKVGDFAEVTGAPVEMDAKGVQRLAGAFRDALFYMDSEKNMRDCVRVITRGGSRVFLERIEKKKFNRFQ